MENYYIVFISLDGMKKALYVNRGKTGDWAMRLNIDFDAWSVKYATLYQHSDNGGYKIKVTHKNNEKITLY